MYLPDSRDLWDVMWGNRKELVGFAHSHPGSGLPGPSHEDLTTFSAVERALGIRLKWWITTVDHLLLLEWSGLKYEPVAVWSDIPDGGWDTDLLWVPRLRQISETFSPCCGRMSQTKEQREVQHE